jgi:hypothetical protein
MSAPEPRRDQGLEVAIGRVGRPSPRARWVAIVWAGALTALVGIAIAARPAAQPAAAPVAVAVTGPHADPAPRASAVPLYRGVILVFTEPRKRTPGEDGLMGSLVFDLEPTRVVVRRWPVGRLPGWTNPSQS